MNNETVRNWGIFLLFRFKIVGDLRIVFHIFNAIVPNYMTTDNLLASQMDDDTLKLFLKLGEVLVNERN